MKWLWIMLMVSWVAGFCSILWMLRLWHKGEYKAAAPVTKGARFRLRAIYGVLISFSLVLISQIYRIISTGKMIGVREGSTVLFMLLAMGIHLWQLPKLRTLAALEPKSPRKPLPPFFWQGCLILLPVAVLVVLGAIFISRDRAFVEEGARQRARGLMGEISPTLGRFAGMQMSNHQFFVQGWWFQLQNDFAAWPGSADKQAWQNNRVPMQKELADLQAKHPGLQPQETAPGQFEFTPTGDYHSRSGMSDPPQPPAWLVSLNPAQRQHWEALSAAADAKATTNELKRLSEALSQTKPPSDALANARFIRLRAELSGAPAGQICERWVRSFDANANALSPTGIPLADLITLEILRASRSTGFNESTWTCLIHTVTRYSSPLTPQILDEAEVLAKINPRLAEAMRNTRLLYTVQERQRKFIRLVQQAVPLNGIVTTNVWIDDDGRQWFCLLDPTYSVTLRSGDNAITNQLTQVRYYPESVIRESFEWAIRASKVELPNYLGATVIFHGRPLSLALGSSPKDSTNSVPLATADGFVTQPAVRMEGNPKPGFEPHFSAEFESVPSHPAFTLSFYLADRNLMLAEHRQRTWWLGGLLAVSALAAVTGFVTARRAFYRQRQLSELKSNFVSSVSHELRAPLASVRLMTESLERGTIREPERQQEYFHLIGRECRRLSGLIENVLDFARIDQGRKQYRFEPTDLVALVQHTVKSLEPYAAERQVRLELAITGATRDEDLDGAAMQQALVNLIDNAVKFSPAGSAVRVELAFLPETVQLTVADQGPGIPVEDQERIFEQFYRRGSELRRETTGIGIGLSIVKHVIEAHRGTVRVESEVAQGSRFVLEWPRSHNQTEATKS